MLATLSTLKIRNLALVQELTWNLEPGFTVITGETGAGKSLIIGALQLLMGARADRGLVRHGAASASLEAFFELGVGEREKGLHQFLEEEGIEPCEEGSLLVRRHIPAEGTGRQFINGVAVPLATLRQLGNLLIDLHGPHDHQSLFYQKTQTLLLDSFAGSTELRLNYQEERRQWMALSQEHVALLQEESAPENLSFLEEQLSEIEAANLKELDEEALLSRHRVATNSQQLLASAQQLIQILEGGDTSSLPSLETLMSQAMRSCREIERLDSEAEAFIALLEGAAGQLQDLGSALRRYSQQIELNEEELQQLEERMSLLATLKRKYGERIEEILQKEEQLRERIARSGEVEQRLVALQAAISAQEKKLLSLAEQLSQKRRQAAPQLVEQICQQMEVLGFRQASFKVDFRVISKEPLDPELPPYTTSKTTSKESSSWGVLGTEEVEFLLAPNPGEPLQPLRIIASSGEVSRLMLALKAAIAQEDTIPILVFDEIDANVGGAIAAQVGKTMKRLGEEHQLLCITHLPQVAALAQHHYAVSKKVEEGRTVTQLQKIADEERELEIARMLGGESEAIRLHARQLLTA